MYAGIAHDAVSLEAALMEALADVSGAQPLEVLSSSRLPIEIEDATLSARTAWEVLRADEAVAAAADGIGNYDLRAVALVYLPAWKFQYTYLGVSLTAWTCGRTGMTDGINCRGLGAQFFEDWLPQQDQFWRRAEGWVRTFDQQAGRAYRENPRAAAEALNTAGKVAALGAASVFRLGARVASRHPKVFLASLIAPYVLSWAKPLVETWFRAAQSQVRAARVQQTPTDDAEELDARADWEALLRRGEERLRGSTSGRSTRERAADKGRAVDLGEPRSVLGLPASGRVSPRTLEAAFRRELLAWHPDRAERTPGAQAAAAERTRAILGAYRAMRRDIGAC